MKKLFIEKEIKYTGAELSAHWIYKNFNIFTIINVNNDILFFYQAIFPIPTVLVKIDISAVSAAVTCIV